MAMTLRDVAELLPDNFESIFDPARVTRVGGWIELPSVYVVGVVDMNGERTYKWLSNGAFVEETDAEFNERNMRAMRDDLCAIKSKKGIQ